MKLVILIPAFNEEATLKNVILSIPKVKGFEQQEVVVVNDGSTDKTEAIAKKNKATVINHNKNKGVGAAFQTGTAKALELEADILVMIDADGQFPASDIPRLIKPIIEKKADMVTASRFMRQTDIPANISPVKLWGNKQVAKIISLLVGKKYHDVACGFRAYSKETLLHLNTFGQFTYTQEVFIDLSMKGLKIMEIPVKVKYFKKRKSRVFKGAFNYAFKALAIILRTIRDYKPLKFFGFLGIATFSLGLLPELFLLIYYLTNHRFSPYISLGFIGAFLNVIGIIFMMLGLIADMLGRIRGNQERILYYEKKKSYEKK